MELIVLLESETCSCGAKKEDYTDLVISQCSECSHIFCNLCFTTVGDGDKISCPRCGEEFELPDLGKKS